MQFQKFEMSMKHAAIIGQIPRTLHISVILCPTPWKGSWAIGIPPVTMEVSASHREKNNLLTLPFGCYAAEKSVAKEKCRNSQHSQPPKCLEHG